MRVPFWLTSEALRIAGGAPQKRPRIMLSDMKQKDDDIEAVRVCFAVEFNAMDFIEQMRVQNRDALVAYASKIENRSIDQIASATVDVIDEYVALKD